MGAVVYWGLYRNYHSIHTTEPITGATQIFLDVYLENEGD